jgi:protocatechuate 3,4-dioxygenase beta subunit
MIGLLGVAGMAAISGPQTAHALDAAPTEAVGLELSTLACVVTPAQTEGPYFVDEKLQRADIRIDPTDGKPRPGTPLRLRLDVARVDGNACAPVPGAMVDIWQCDAVGIYSDVKDFQGLFDTRGQKFLRGYQVTGRDGAAEFTTIYPGWYAGRAVHIHFKIRVPAGQQRAYEFTSQLYFDESVTDNVHARPPYNTKPRRDTLNVNDRTYAGRSGRGGDGQADGSQLMLALTREGDGFAARLAVGLRMG